MHSLSELLRFKIAEASRSMRINHPFSVQILIEFNLASCFSLSCLCSSTYSDGSHVLVIYCWCCCWLFVCRICFSTVRFNWFCTATDKIELIWKKISSRYSSQQIRISHMPHNIGIVSDMSCPICQITELLPPPCSITLDSHSIVKTLTPWPQWTHVQNERKHL